MIILKDSNDDGDKKLKGLKLKSINISYLRDVPPAD